MKRLYILPAFLVIFMLGPNAASGADNAEVANTHIRTGIAYYEHGQSEVFADLKKLDDALQEFREALRLDPGSVQAHYYLGLTCLAMDAMRCAEKEYLLLKGLDKAMAKKLLAQLTAYRQPTRFEHVSTKGEAWKAPEKIKVPASETAAPATTESKTGCEIVSFSTYDEPSGIRKFSEGGTIYEEQKRCLKATIRNTGTSKVGANQLMIEAHFSDGDTMKERIDGIISDMSVVEPGGTVTGSVCFKKEKATITVVECGIW